jgi:syntaxin 1B/2/3
MSQYGGYNQSGGGYGQSNPYAQQNYGGGGGGGAGRYNDNVEMEQYEQPAGGRYGGGLPSGPRPGGAGAPAGYGGTPAGGYEGNGYGNQGGGNAGGNLLNQCRDIDQAIDDLGRRLQDLQGLHSRVLNDRASNDDVDRMNSEVMSSYRNLGERLKKIKSNPESGNPTNAPQVGRVDRKLKKAINDFQRVESDFRRQMQDQQMRQYRVVNPTASEEEARHVVEDLRGGVFEQAVSQQFPDIRKMIAY